MSWHDLQPTHISKSLHLSSCRRNKRRNIGQVFTIFNLSTAIRWRCMSVWFVSLFPLDYIIQTNRRKKTTTKKHVTPSITLQHERQAGVSAKIGCSFDIPCDIPLVLLKVHPKSVHNKRIRGASERTSDTLGNRKTYRARQAFVLFQLYGCVLLSSERPCRFLLL